MACVEAEVGDWVLYEDEDGEEIISVVTRLDGVGIYTKQTGKYWLTINEILEVRKKGTPMNTPNLDRVMAHVAIKGRHAHDCKHTKQLYDLFIAHAPALVAALKNNLDVLKGCEFAMNTFLPDSKFVAQEGLNRIQPAIEEIETLLTQLDQEAKG